MKTFAIKSSLAAGLAHRLKTMDAQVVVDVCGTDAIAAIRSNQRVVSRIVEANAEFEAAINVTETKKRAFFEKVQAEYAEAAKTLSKDEAAAKATELTASFNAASAEAQKESKANPETIVWVGLSDEDYSQVLLPVFKKTAQLWDVNGDGSGQALFLEVADAIESAI